MSAFVFELQRALRGNGLSWAYVFEWPVLGLYGVYVWRKLLQEERSDEAKRTSDIPVKQEEEEARATYNAYLRLVHRDDNTVDKPNE